MDKKTRTTLTFPVLAVVSFTGMVIYLFGLQGSAGLFRWYLRIPLAPVVVAVLLPLLFASLHFLFLGRSARAARMLRIASTTASILVMLVAYGLFSYLYIKPRMGSPDTPRLAIIEPEAGIPYRDAGSPGHDGVLRVSIGSDAHWGAASANARARESILRGIAEAVPRRDAFFMLGDSTELGMNAAEWREQIADLERLVPEVPLRPLLGNHDAIAGGEHNFRRAFFPAGMRSDSGSPYHYSVRAENAVFVVLNLPWGTENFDRAQTEWLERTLAGIPPGKARVVLSHSYFHASGYDDPRTGVPWYDHPENLKTVAPILERHGVDLVVSGHNHYMEYLEHAGISYVVVGAMGGVPDPEPTYRSPASLWIRQGGYGRLDLSIDDATIELLFLDESGEALYRRSIPFG